MREHQNNAVLVGKVLSIGTREHKGNCFKQLMLEIPRLSENKDIVPVSVIDKLFIHEEINIGDYVEVTGTIRTRNEEKHLIVYCNADKIEKIEGVISNVFTNLVDIEGVICKEPRIRTVKSGRIITNLLLACNHTYGIKKSFYIPCITWGVNATSSNKLKVGDLIRIDGRFQSRTYHKSSDLYGEEHTAYEISVKNYVLEDNLKNNKENNA